MVVSVAVVMVGSIPACAGEPRSRRRCTPEEGVYPRVCGGTATSASRPNAEQGLSPRVRGNRVATSGIAQLPRSIPACAGEPTAILS